MIDDLDRTLERLLRAKGGLPRPDYEIGFDIPTETWGQSLSKPAVNLYLHDIRENHDLRLGWWHDELQPDGSFVRRRPDVRLDCYYAVTTFTPKDARDPLEEHRLLAVVLRTLLRYPTLPPEILVGGLVAQEPPLPYLVAQMEGLPQPPAEFWSALGNKLRPSINLVVTIALRPTVLDDVPDRLTPVVSEMFAVGVSGGRITELELAPAAAGPLEPGATLSRVALAAQSSGALATAVFAASDTITVSDGRTLEANSWALIDDGGDSELVRIGIRPAAGPTAIPLDPPLAFAHAAARPVAPAAVTTPSASTPALAADAARGDTSIEVTEGKGLKHGTWVVVSDGARSEGVLLTSNGVNGQSTLTLAHAVRFDHPAGRPVLPVTVAAATTDLRDPAGQTVTSLTLAAAANPALAPGDRIRIGRGADAEFAGVAGAGGTGVTLSAPLTRNHAQAALVRALGNETAVGRLARRVAPGDATVAATGEAAAALGRGDVVKLGDGPSASYHEVRAATSSFGAVHEPAEEFLTIGGRVTDDGDPPEPVRGARVEIEDAAKRTVVDQTDAAGRFLFPGLAPEQDYTLTVTAPGFDGETKTVHVPARKSTEYDVALTPN